MANTRKERFETARQMIGDNPKWGKRRINQELRYIYGVGLRDADVLSLKTSIILPGLDQAEKRYYTLVKEGFLPTEARALTAEPISSLAMEKYRRERRQLRAEARRMKIPLKQQNKFLRADYKIEGYWQQGGIDPLARYADYASKYPVAARRAKRPAGTDEQRHIYRQWLKAGFLPKEARELTYGHGKINVDAHAVYHSQLGIKARAVRRRWIRTLQKKGWTLRAVKAEIMNYYTKDGGRSEWDFIREHYHVIMKLVASVYRQQAAKRAKARTKDLYRVS